MRKGGEIVPSASKRRHVDDGSLEDIVQQWIPLDVWRHIVAPYALLELPLQFGTTEIAGSVSKFMLGPDGDLVLLRELSEDKFTIEILDGTDFFTKTRVPISVEREVFSFVMFRNQVVLLVDGEESPSLEMFAYPSLTPAASWTIPPPGDVNRVHVMGDRLMAESGRYMLEELTFSGDQIFRVDTTLDSLEDYGELKDLKLDSKSHLVYLASDMGWIAVRCSKCFRMVHVIDTHRRAEISYVLDRDSGKGIRGRRRDICMGHDTTAFDIDVDRVWVVDSYSEDLRVYLVDTELLARHVCGDGKRSTCDDEEGEDPTPSSPGPVCTHITMTDVRIQRHKYTGSKRVFTLARDEVLRMFS